LHKCRGCASELEVANTNGGWVCEREEEGTLQSQTLQRLVRFFFLLFLLSPPHFLIRNSLQCKALVQTQRNSNQIPRIEEIKDPMATSDNLINVLLVHIFVAIGFFTRISSPGRGRFIHLEKTLTRTSHHHTFHHVFHQDGKPRVYSLYFTLLLTMNRSFTQYLISSYIVKFLIILATSFSLMLSP
jgi:hypothetical protein